MKKLLQAAAVIVLGAGLSGGLVSAATGSITDTGHDSSATISSTNQQSVDTTNTLHATVNHNNPQNATTGAASETDNTLGGGAATTGGASNVASFTAGLTVSGSGSAEAGMGALTPPADTSTIGTTGANSTTSITTNNTSTVHTTNTLDFNVNTNTDQHASTGAASVTGNTQGGSATSGPASNQSTDTVTLSVSH